MEARIRERAGRRQAEDNPMPGRLHSRCGCLAVAVSSSERVGWWGGRSQGLNSGDWRQEENGMGIVEGGELSWPMQKVRLHD